MRRNGGAILKEMWEREGLIVKMEEIIEYLYANWNYLGEVNNETAGEWRDNHESYTFGIGLEKE